MVGTDDEFVMRTILKILQKYRDKIFTINQLAKMADIFPLDAECCVRELQKAKAVKADWIEFKDKTFDLFISLGEKGDSYNVPKEITASTETPDPMYG